MTADDRLARSYRRLLRAYPRSYLRVRGLEMLTTFLDAAPPGRRRPTVRDVLDIVGGGLRFRMRVPPLPTFRLAAVAAALVGAGITAWAGAWAGWHTAPAVPTRAEVVAAATVAVPDAARRLPARHHHCDRHCWGNPSHEMITYGDPFQDDNAMPSLDDPDRPRTTTPAVNRVYLPLVVPHAEMAAVAVQAHDRLAAAGWRVSPVRTHFDLRFFWATKGDLTLRFEGRGPTQPDAPAVAINVHRDAPGATLPAAAAGALVGGPVGWWLAVATVRRYLRHGRQTRLAMTVLAAPGLAVVGISAFGLFVGTVDAVVRNGPGTAQSVLLGNYAVGSPVIVVLIGALLVCVTVGQLPAAGPPPDLRPVT